MSELKTIKFPGDAEPRVIVDGAAVHFDKPQALHPEMQAQARANIGAVCDYYSTTREKLAVTLGEEAAVYDDVNSAVVWGLYNAIMAEHSDRVKKLVWVDATKEWSAEWENYTPTDNTFVNYVYVVSTGEYNEKAGSISRKDDDIKKPKYLVASGLHGFEKASIVSTYRLFRDIVTGHNIPARFREGCVIHFLPVGNPWGLDNDSRFNGNIKPDTNQGVDINRNFAWDHGQRVQTDKADNVGTAPESEKETQAIANWLRENVKDNKKVELFLDIHNVGAVPNEIATVTGLTDSEEYNKRKKIAMKGIDRVAPFWRDAIGYAESTIFQHSASFDEGGMSIFYASEELGIPSLCLEIATRPTGTEASAKNLLPETVAVGAEVIGNVLLEFYEQYSMGEVVDMTETNGKLDTLAEDMNQTSGKVDAVAEGVTKTSGKIDNLSENMGINMNTIIGKLNEILRGTGEPSEPVEPTYGFDIKSGFVEISDDASTMFRIDCPNDPKIVVVMADATEKDEKGRTTYDRIIASRQEGAFIGAVGQKLVKLTSEANPAERYWSYMSVLCQYADKYDNDKDGDKEETLWGPKTSTTMFRDATTDEGGGVALGAPPRLAGRYNWTAYYWNEPESEPEQE